MFIIYAIFTEQSVGRLFIAGIIPGLITATVYSVSIVLRVKFNPNLAPPMQRETPITIQHRLVSLTQTWPVALLATIVLGGIYTGVFTPTEAGAAGAFATLILGIFLGKLGKLSTIKEALRESAQTTAMVFMIIVGALFFTRVLAITRIPMELSTLILGWHLPKMVVLVIILMLWFLLGMIIIPSGICALTLPIVFPIVVDLGFDPIWFGVITLKLAEIAAVTPPVGLNVYTLKGVAGEGTSIEEVFQGIWPFVICDVLVLIALIILPQLSLYLPNLMMGK